MTILHIEDDPMMQDVVAETCHRFMRPNCQVIHAINLAQATTVYYNNKPDIILLDQMLPDGDGLEWVCALNPPPACPILVMTGNDIEAFIRSYQGPLNLSFLTKPFRPRDLAEKIQALALSA